MKTLLLLLSILFSCQLASANESGRQRIDINAGWKFQPRILNNAPAAVEYDDNAWTQVNIPHTWNNTDAQDGGGNYLRTVGWYRKSIPWSDAYNNKKLYIEFLAASLQAECFVNGESVGLHKGGYTAFRFDITSAMKKGNNIIAIKVDNRFSQEIMPLGGDFSFLGGIYRNVSLIVADPVHADLMDNASSGLYLTPSEVSTAKADLEIKSNIVNQSAVSKTVTITGVLRHPDTFEAIADVPNPAFDTSTMYSGGEVVKSVSKTVTILPNSAYDFKEQVSVENPRLWDGKQDPYRYRVDFTIREDNNLLDSITEYIGFRYFSVTKEGFFLNGHLYPLRGVNRHQDRYNMGYAITSKEHNEDFSMIYDIGANTVRLAHYPHDPYMYDLCDRYGLVVWAEIPLVDTPGSAATFNEVTKNQLRELIRQQYNRPSIFFWGLQNEIRSHHDEHMKVLMKELNDLAHADDATRLTVQASNHATARNWDSDVFAWNYYPGWYVQNPRFSDKLDDFKKSEPRPTALSEYGAGGSIYHHEINPPKPVTNGGKFHPEEYQNKVHEQAVIDFSTRDFVWGTFLWNMFDFASDGRNEGDTPGMNNKGLVTYDRKIKKDSYFLYKANWSTEPVVYISSRRYVERKERITPVTVYSNCDSVELFVNGTSIGKKHFDNVQCGIYRWDNIELPGVENIIRVVTLKDTREYTDEVIWKKSMGTSTDVFSEQLVVDNDSKRIVLKGEVSVEDMTKYLSAAEGATFILVQADGKTPVTDGIVSAGMKLVVTSEDGKNTAVYEFVTGHIALGKTVKTDSEEADNPVGNALDGDYTTRWAAKDRNAHWLEVDLGKEYVLNKVTIHWYNPNGTRTYQYNVLTASEDKNYATEVNRTANNQSDAVTDNLNNRSRYVKIDVTGANATTAYASLYEVEIYGWAMTSAEYAIDHVNRTIGIPGTEENKTNLTTEKFLANISFDGNMTYNLNSVSYFIQENDELIITDLSGKETKFKCVFTTESSIKDYDINNLPFSITNHGNIMNIRLNNPAEPAKLEIWDLLGQMILSGKIKDTYTCRLETGFYIVGITAPQSGREAIKYLIR